MKALTVFGSRFGGKVALNPEFVLERAQRYYLLNPALRKVTRGDFYYAGLYLGKVKNGIFFPSFNFLNILAPIAANKVVLDRKSGLAFHLWQRHFQERYCEVDGFPTKRRLHVGYE